MNRLHARHFLRGALIALIAVAFATSALSHRAPSAKDLQLAAFEIAIGGSPSLCGDTGEDGPSSQDRCIFCRLAASTILPEPGLTPNAADARVLARLVLPPARQDVSLSSARVPPTRGPPLA